MPRAQTDEQLALAGLRKAVKDGRPGAANDLARFLARRDRHKNPTPTEQRAAENQARRDAQSRSRATVILGAAVPDEQAPSILGWLLLSDEEQDARPEQGAAVEAAFQRTLAAQADYIRTHSSGLQPGEAERQEQADAEQREIQTWYRGWRDSVDNPTTEETPVAY